MSIKIILFLLSALLSNLCYSAEKTVIRLGVLAFGTVNWELTIINNQHLLDDHAIQLDIRPVANPQAGKIALQSGAVDMIVSDWIWTSRLRASGSDFTFYPYSTTSGALVVAKNSPITSLNDLNGKKLGIAGGELDKNWLLLQALAQQQNKIDLNTVVEKVYGAPPLLNQQLIQQRVDGIMTYWHYAAKLEAAGYRQIISGQEILNQLGIKEKVPTLGYVFSQNWANKHKNAVNQFLKATQLAKNQLCQVDKVWQKIIPLTKAKDTVTQNTLRNRYCDGRIKQWGEKEQQAATQIYALLRQLSQNKLTGKNTTLEEGTFW